MWFTDVTEAQKLDIHYNLFHYNCMKMLNRIFHNVPTCLFLSFDDNLSVLQFMTWTCCLWGHIVFCH